MIYLVQSRNAASIEERVFPTYRCYISLNTVNYSVFSNSEKCDHKGRKIALYSICCENQT